MQSAAAEYDAFAWFYRKHWSAHYYSWVMAVLDRILPLHLEPGASVLDLCCGVGTITRALAAAGYHATGVERSPAMIDFARQDVPDAFFLECDVRSFRMPLAFHGAVCAFDSLSHITEPRELQAIFDNVYASLLPRGIFVFDLNLEEVYRAIFNEICTVVEDDSAFIIRGNFNQAERLARTELTMFRDMEGQWKRYDATLLQRCYDPAEIRRMALEAGFASAGVVDVPRDLGIPDRQGEGRAFFLAVKSASPTRLRAEQSSMPLRSRAKAKARRRRAVPVPRQTETR